MSDESSTAPPLPTFPVDAEVCGNCKLWRAHSVDHRGWVGPCRLQEERGLFPPTAPGCDHFAPKGVATVVRREAPAVSRAVRSVAPLIVKKGREGNEPADLGGDLNMTRDELMEIFREAAGEKVEVPLAPKWEGGVMQLVPGRAEVQVKELPIDALFHKVVMVRDRLRTLEQKINAHAKLTDAEKVDMQQYITRCYGSLTSFNVLFRDKGDHFIGQKGED